MKIMDSTLPEQRSVKGRYAIEVYIGKGMVAAHFVKAKTMQEALVLALRGRLKCFRTDGNRIRASFPYGRGGYRIFTRKGPSYKWRMA